MKPGRRSLAMLPIGACLLLLAAPCRAAWPSGPAANLPVCTVPLSQDVPQIIADGSGGVIIAWQGTGTNGAKGVFVQRVDPDGQAAWGGGNGIAVSASPADQQQPMLVPDSSGGAIVVWQDFRSGDNWDVFAQRIDRSGVVRWASDGVPLSMATGDQLVPQVASDGHGGAVVAWQDLRDGPGPDLYAQAVDSAGGVRWSVDGIPVGAGPGAQLLSQVVAGGTGGLFVWKDSRGSDSGASVYVQRVDSIGAPTWGADGVLLDENAALDAHPSAVADGQGGLIVAWESGPVHSQRLDESGRRLWGKQGIMLSSAAASAPAIAPDGDGGALVAWQTLSSEDAATEVRAQSVLASGALRWGAGGVAVCRASGPRTALAMAPSRAGGAIVMWRDARNDPFGSLNAQRVDSSGTCAWRMDGVAVSTAPGVQSALAICSDGAGGAVATWTDGRDGRHIFAQRVAPRGKLGGVVVADRPAPRARP